MVSHQVENSSIAQVLSDPSDPRVFLLSLVRDYKGFDADEEASRVRFLSLLTNYPKCFENTCNEGHITGSGLVVNSELTKVLFMHHARLGIWLQFGGHSDGHVNPFATALREVMEESGLKNLTFHPRVPYIFDLDGHPIPKDSTLDVPHDHYDIRSLFIADPAESVVINRESHDIKWIPFEDLPKYNNERPLARMLEKVKALI